MSDRGFGEFLVTQGILHAEGLRQALDTQKSMDGRLDRLTEEVDGEYRIRHDPPKVLRVDELREESERDAIRSRTLSACTKDITATVLIV